MNLLIEKKLLDEMRKHGEETYPNECCGFFFGKDGEQRKLTHVQPVSNAKEGDQRKRFEINPKDYQQAEKYALKNNLDFLCVYHSHPDHAAVPSEHDRKVAMPFFSYIIISVRNGRSGDIRSWRLNEQREFEEEILTETHYSKQIST